MNLLNALPTTVDIDGRPVPINPDFRLCVRFEQEMLNRAVDLPGILQDFYPQGLPADTEAAVDRLLWFYRCGDTTDAVGKATGAVQARAYDFEVDADALFASFLTAYSVDLSTATLHWWAFRALMFGLPSDTPFMLRVHYRTADTSGMPKGEKKRYDKMRAQFALPGRGLAFGGTLEDRDARMKAYVLQRFAEVRHDES